LQHHHEVARPATVRQPAGLEIAHEARDVGVPDMHVPADEYHFIQRRLGRAELIAKQSWTDSRAPRIQTRLFEDVIRPDPADSSRSRPNRHVSSARSDGVRAQRDLSNACVPMHRRAAGDDTKPKDSEGGRACHAGTIYFTMARRLATAQRG
jgi:hypothetical protein